MEIEECRWSEPFAQYDMTPGFRCVKPGLIEAMNMQAREKNEAQPDGTPVQYVDCLCLGFPETCFDFERIK
jgi:hypothetical protein